VVTAVYSYGNALVARNGEVVLSDGLGTTRATVNGVQAITSTSTTEAFGNAVAQWGSTGNPYRFAGAWGYRDDGDATARRGQTRSSAPTSLGVPGAICRFFCRTWGSNSSAEAGQLRTSISESAVASVAQPVSSLQRAVH
jgi:uncharacterized protein YegP (UPF0339 family)